MSQVLRRLPGGRTTVAHGIPVVGQLVAAEKTHLARARDEDAGLDHPLDRSVLRAREDIRLAVGPFEQPALLEPRNGEARIGIEVALLLGENLVQRLID